jgi:hypothetical protein
MNDSRPTWVLPLPRERFKLLPLWVSGRLLGSCRQETAPQEVNL